MELQAIGGLTMGADPIVVAVSVISGKFNGFLVRKAEKQHGTGQRIEGFREKGREGGDRRRRLHDGSIDRAGDRGRTEFGFEVVARCAWWNARKRTDAQRRESGIARALYLDFYRERCAQGTRYAERRDLRIRRYRSRFAKSADSLRSPTSRACGAKAHNDLVELSLVS